MSILYGKASCEIRQNFGGNEDTCLPYNAHVNIPTGMSWVITLIRNVHHSACERKREGPTPEPQLGASPSQHKFSGIFHVLRWS